MSTSTTESAYLGVPGFVPGTLSATTLLSVYGLSSLFVVSIVWLFSGRSTKIDRVIMCWWVFTGLTHMILEGYFVFSPDFFKDTTGHFLKEVWKEYSKGDLRYALRDSAIVTVEGLTAVLEGPACILAVHAIATKKSYSHVLQLAIALGQLYGTFVYYITAILDGDNYSATPYHYYAYYIGANAWWLLIPSLIAIRSWKKIYAAFEAQNNRNKTKARRD